MKINAIRMESQEAYERDLYKEAARRVVFSNCQESCGVDDKSVPNFNRAFYYGMPGAQHCLQDCFNNRMKLHFGSYAEAENMLLDFGAMKREYQMYERWNPHVRTIKDMTTENTADYVQSVT